MSQLGPHGAIACSTERERFLAEVFDRLWSRYRTRVDYVRVYENVIAQAGATFVNDHLAFRTIACSELRLGISVLSRLFEALGYRAAGCYLFEDKHLNATHFAHPNPQFPKLFLSEFRLWEVASELRNELLPILKSHRANVDDQLLATLVQLDEQPLDPSSREALLEQVVAEFHTPPWDVVQRQTVLRVNNVSQYAAWVLVHGYNVNHFTSLINSHQVPTLDTIQKTVDALRAAGVPMKDEIEGSEGSKLRQSATQAASINVPIADGLDITTMPWSYAYFELAERGFVTDTEGAVTRFEGFLGPQATHLFEMTKVMNDRPT